MPEGSVPQEPSKLQYIKSYSIIIDSMLPTQPERSRHADFLRNIKLDQLTRARSNLVETFSPSYVDHADVRKFVHALAGPVNFPMIIFTDGTKLMEEHAKIDWAIKGAGLTTPDMATYNQYLQYYPALHVGVVSCRPDLDGDLEIYEAKRQAMRLYLYGMTSNLLYPSFPSESLAYDGLVLVEEQPQAHFARVTSFLTSMCEGNLNNVFNIGLCEWVTSSWSMGSVLEGNFPEVLRAMRKRFLNPDAHYGKNELKEVFNRMRRLVPFDGGEKDGFPLSMFKIGRADPSMDNSPHILAVGIMEMLQNLSPDFIQTLVGAKLGASDDVASLGGLTNFLMQDTMAFNQLSQLNIYSEDMLKVYLDMRAKYFKLIDR